MSVYTCVGALCCVVMLAALDLCSGTAHSCAPEGWLLEVREPFCSLILNGSKTIETRGYPLPTPLNGTRVQLFATPAGGPVSDLASVVASHHHPELRILGSVIFTQGFRYQSATAFERDQRRHLVDPSSEFGYISKGGLIYGWGVAQPVLYKVPQPVPKRMVRFFRSVFRPDSTDTRTTINDAVCT